MECLVVLWCAVVCRFVEDNWESPVLGAWGLGWEVWLDGMEVTQFTYFQQVRGRRHAHNQGWIGRLAVLSSFQLAPHVALPP